MLPLRFQGFFRGRIKTTLQGKIREPLLRYVGMFMAFVWTERIKSAYSHNANDSAEDIGLFEVKVKQVFRLLFDKFNGIPEVGNS